MQIYVATEKAFSEFHLGLGKFKAAKRVAERMVHEETMNDLKCVPQAGTSTSDIVDMS
jgi:hypothetical protein